MRLEWTGNDNVGPEHPTAALRQVSKNPFHSIKRDLDDKRTKTRINERNCKNTIYYELKKFLSPEKNKYCEI